MNDARIEAWIALLDAGVSFAVLNRLVQAFGGPEEVLAASDSDWAAMAAVRSGTADRLRESQRDKARRELQLDAFFGCKMTIVERGGAGYPRLLAEADEPPPALFVRGSWTPEDDVCIAIVGPRLATPYGLEMARRLSRDLAPVVTIASGLARGIDETAHHAAVEAGGRTVGCAACGLDQDYPQGTEEMRSAIAGNGALLSPWPPLTKPATHRFPQRNAVLAALSLGVVIVEASEKSGALVTARAAADAGREVFAVPGDATRRNSRGTNQLLREGASVASCAQDILEDLAPRLGTELSALLARRRDKADPEPQASTALALSDAEAVALSLVAHAPLPYDELVAAFAERGLAVGELASALLTLELQGLVRPQPGKVYSATAAGAASASPPDADAPET